MPKHLFKKKGKKDDKKPNGKKNNGKDKKPNGKDKKPNKFELFKKKKKK